LCDDGLPNGPVRLRRTRRACGRRSQVRLEGRQRPALGCLCAHVTRADDDRQHRSTKEAASHVHHQPGPYPHRSRGRRRYRRIHRGCFSSYGRGHRPITITPIVVNQPLTAHVSPVKGAASAGIAGYDDATCASLAQDNNTAVASGNQAEAAGETDAASSNYNLANNIYKQLSDNCMVID